MVEANRKNAIPESDQSSRLRIRCGKLARTDREDPNGDQEVREPDELFALLLHEAPEEKNECL